MSTRANIIIKDSQEQIFFYRHSDGYPEGALPTLKKFMSWVKEKRIRDNVTQAAGWLILIGAKEYESVYVGAGKHELKPTMTEPSTTDRISGWQCGAYEPTTGIHGNIEYLYTLDIVKLIIIVQAVIGTGKYKTIETIKDFSETPKEEPKLTDDPNELEIV